MQLFLTSYRTGNHKDKFKLFLKKNNVEKAVVIENAKDYKSTVEEREESLNEFKEYFSHCGLEMAELDLRKHFNQTTDWFRYFKKVDLVMVTGGNTFVLRRAMEKAGIIPVIKQRISNEKLVYFGESAGACIVAPTLKGVEYGDEPDILPEGYEGMSRIDDGLGIVRFHIVPHYGSEWPGALEMERILRAEKEEYMAIRDDEVIIIRGDNVEKY